MRQLMVLVQTSVLVAVLTVGGVAYWEVATIFRQLVVSEATSVGNLLGVMAATDLGSSGIRAATFQEVSLKIIKEPGEVVKTTILQRADGMVVASTEPMLVGKTLTDDRTAEAMKATLQNPYVYLHGREFELATPVEIDGQPWGIVRLRGEADLNSFLLILAVPILGAVILVVLISALITYFRARRLSRPLRQLSEQAHKIAAGDLSVTVQVPTKRTDEVTQLAADFNQMASSMRSLVLDLQLASDQVVETSRQLAEGATETTRAVEHIALLGNSVNDQATQQAGDTREAALVMRELSGAIEQIARGAVSQAGDMARANEVTARMGAVVSRIGNEIDEVTTAAQVALRAAGAGQASVSETSEGMTRIAQAVEVVASQMERLADSTERINAVIALIGEVADQTNLLALNAAIEAARAGEAGKGFAVVADEVRRLASRTQGAAGEVSSLIEEIKTGTAEVLAAVERGTSEVEAGSQLATNAAGSLDEIVRSVQETERRATTILRDARELVESSRKVQESIAEVAAVAEESSAAAEEMTAASEQVSGLIGHVEQVSQQAAVAVGSMNRDTHQVFATAEEIAASAETMMEGARRLQEAVRKFKV